MRRLGLVGALTAHVVASLAVPLHATAVEPALHASAATHARGRIVWTVAHFEEGDGYDETWNQGSEGVATIAMERRGSEWVDAGSSFSVRYLSRRAPYCYDPSCVIDCTILVEETYWVRAARFDTVDSPTGRAPSSISLWLEDDGRAAVVDLRVGGGPHLVTIASTGTDCQGRDGETLVPWSPDFALGADPRCPVAAGGVRGTVDRAGTRFSFRCTARTDGPSVSGDVNVTDIAVVSGYLRFTHSP